MADRPPKCCLWHWFLTKTVVVDLGLLGFSLWWQIDLQNAVFGIDSLQKRWWLIWVCWVSHYCGRSTSKTPPLERERERENRWEEAMLLGFCFSPKRKSRLTSSCWDFVFVSLKWMSCIGLTNKDYSLMLLSSIGLMSSIVVLLLLQHEVCKVAQTWPELVQA